MTQLVCIDNGWMYLFQFSGTNTHQLYSDFEKLLNSVEYPGVSNVEATESPKPTTSKPTTSKRYQSDKNSGIDSKDNTSKNNSGVIAVFVLLIVVPAIVAAVVVTRKKNLEITNQSGYSTNNNASVTKPVVAAEQTITCKNCGQTLPSDSSFCHMCGTKVD